MSGVMVLANSVVVLILIFVLWCVLFRSRDVKLLFKPLSPQETILFNHCRHYARWRVDFLYGGFIDYSFWILKEQTIRTNIGHVQIYNENYFQTSNKTKA